MPFKWDQLNYPQYHILLLRLYTAKYIVCTSHQIECANKVTICTICVIHTPTERAKVKCANTLKRVCYVGNNRCALVRITAIDKNTPYEDIGIFMLVKCVSCC